MKVERERERERERDRDSQKQTYLKIGLSMWARFLERMYRKLNTGDTSWLFKLTTTEKVHWYCTVSQLLIYLLLQLRNKLHHSNFALYRSWFLY